MSLQVRMRHALGERVLELPERGVSEPLVVGRGREADVQVPSISVAPQHCVLFVHENQWVVQQVAGMVTLNGEGLAEPTVLQTGDVLSLGNGPSAPTLEIDPIGAAEGRSGPVTAAASTASLEPESRPIAPVWGAPMPAPAPAPRPIYHTQAPPAQEGGFETDNAQTDIQDTIDWNSTAPAAPSPAYRRPKPRNTSEAALALMVIFGFAALAVVMVIAYNYTHKPPPPRPIVAVEPPPRFVVPKAKGLFDLNADQAAARAEHAPKQADPASPPEQPAAPAEPAPAVPASSETGPGPGASAPAPTPGPTAAGPGSDDSDTTGKTPTGEADPGWAEIELARYDVRHIGLSVIKYDEYRRDHPGKFTAQLDQYTEEAANWLYWERVGQLWKKRDGLTAEIRQKDQDLRNQPAGAFHDQLAKERAGLVAKYDDTNAVITNEMGYSNDVAPDLESPTQLAKLSQSRDREKYAAFKRHALKYVRDNHGAVWWDGET